MRAGPRGPGCKHGEKDDDVLPSPNGMASQQQQTCRPPLRLEPLERPKS